MHCDNRWMVQLGRSPGLSETPSDSLAPLVLRDLEREDNLFDRYITIQDLIVRSPDLPHPAFTNAFSKLVALRDEPRMVRHT